MLILAIFSLASWLINFIFNLVFSLLPFTELPENILSYVEQFFNILAMGVDLFSYLLGPVARTLISIVISLEAFKALWDLIWFVIRKIKVQQ